MMNFSIIIDSREKKLEHIKSKLDLLGIKSVKRKLKYGDYSFEANGKSYENEIVIERKASLSEITGNFTKGKARFEREFKRSKGCKMILMIEDDEESINNHNYRSKLPPSKLKSKLKTWCNHFQLSIIFIKKTESAEFMINIFKNYLNGCDQEVEV